MKQQQCKRLEVADPATFGLLLEMRYGAKNAVEDIDKRLDFIRNQSLRSADADDALTMASSTLRSFLISLDQFLEAEVKETGVDGGPLVWKQDRDGMYWMVELAKR